QECENVVYGNEAWWSDKWSAFDCGRAYDPSRSFFEQFGELNRVVPQLALARVECENSDYNTGSYKCKDCYMNSCADYCVNTHYSYIVDHMQDSVDCTASDSLEKCYACTDCDKLFNCVWCRLSQNCHNCFFCTDCKDCSDCFGSSGLRHKEFVWFGAQLSKDEYLKRFGAIERSQTGFEKYQKMADTERLTRPQRFAAIFNSVDSSGDYIWYSKNVKLSYDIKKAEDCKYCAYLPLDIKDAEDCYATGLGERLYNVMTGGAACYNLRFCIMPFNGGKDMTYCINCVSDCADLFGCCGLKKAKYCILNKQYSKEDYFKLRDQIIAKMKADGEWGEYFPKHLSPFGYNETVAYEYYPLSKEGAEKKGFNWRDNLPYTTGKETLKLSELPDSIDDVETLKLVNAVLACEKCARNYKLIKAEVEFYKSMRVPFPRLCPTCRHEFRLKLRNPRKLAARTCACAGMKSANGVYSNQATHAHGANQCSNKFETTYDADRPEIVYCEKCYQEEIG
ncbi:MAG: hypothetical protein V1821_01720, partial [bacterium]